MKTVTACSPSGSRSRSVSRKIQYSSALTGNAQGGVLDPDDRADFLIMKRALANKELEALKLESRERGIDLDRLIFTNTFGPERTKKYEHLL